MALYDRRLDPVQSEGTRNGPSTPSSLAGVLPIILAVALAALLIAMFYPDGGGQLGDSTNTGPSVKTVTPQLSPSTSPAVPTPTPTTQPRPTQAPIH